MQGSANYCPQAKSSPLPIFIWFQTKNNFYNFLTTEENKKKKFHDMWILYKIQVSVPPHSLSEPQLHTLKYVLSVAAFEL